MQRAIGLLLLICLWIPHTASAAFDIGISEAAGTVSGTSATTAAVTTTSGSTLIVCSTISASLFSSVSDSKSNTWTQVNTTLTNTGAFAESRCHKNVGGTRGTSHTFTLTGTGTATLSLMVIEVTDAGDVDQHARQNDDTSPVNSGNITTTEATEILIGYASTDSGITTWCGGTSSCGNSFTKLDEIVDQGASGWISVSAYRAVSSTGTYSSDFSETSLANGMGWIISVKASGGGPVDQFGFRYRLRQ